MSRMLRLLRVLLPSALLILVGGCTPGAAPDESEVLISLTDRIIVPGYEALAAEAQDLRQALDNLCAAPSDATLQAARQAWRDVRAPWMRSEATWFGPVMDRRAVSVMDWSPTDPERIEKMLASNPAVTAAAVREGLSSTQRGLGAIEYLLFGNAAPERLSGPASVHCRYLMALGSVVESEAQAIAADWTEVGEKGRAYRDFFTGRSASSLLEGQAVAELVRTQVFLLRTITDMRLAAALGLREGGPDPAAIPGGAGHNALADLRYEILGMRDMYLGHDGSDDQSDALGISALVIPLSDETDQRMRDQFTAALAAIEAVEPPLRVALQEQPQRVQAVHERLLDLRRTLNTEVVSLLGVSVGFSDTDGDSLR